MIALLVVFVVYSAMIVGFWMITPWLAVAYIVGPLLMLYFGRCVARLSERDR